LTSHPGPWQAALIAALQLLTIGISPGSLTNRAVNHKPSKITPPIIIEIMTAKGEYERLGLRELSRLP
jgi:hypothetical protein